jgi:hypothetical protein
MSRKILTFLLVVIMLCSISITSFAAENEELAERAPDVGVRMTYISSVYIALSISPSGLSNSYARILAYDGVDEVRISMYLQRYDNGWKTVNHWAKNFDGTYGYLSKDWYVTSGYEYRVLAYYYAYEGNNTESLSRIYDGVWY